MSKIRAWIQRDRYGIVRGGLVLSVVIAVCAVMIVRVMLGYGRSAEQERAMAAVQRVAGQFEQLLEDSFSQLESAAELMDGGVPEAQLLEGLAGGDSFADAGVIRDGTLRRADGSEARMAEALSYPYYSSKVSSAKIVLLADGSVQLRVSLAGGGQLAAWLDAEALDGVLGGAYVGDYDYAVYNTSTGAYLINRTPYAQGGFYDAMLEISQHDRIGDLMSGSEGQARIAGEGGGVYIVQRPSGIQSWNVALFIPEALVADDGSTATGAHLLVGLSTILLIGMLIFFEWVVLRRLSERDAAAQASEHLQTHMMGVAAAEAGATIFVHRRGRDSGQLCFDGLGLLGEPTDRAGRAALPEILSACKLEEEDAERIQERVRDLGPGQSAELIISSSARGKEDHVLRFALSAPADAPDDVVVSVQDCTLKMISKDQAEAERSYRAAVEPRASAIWEINISRNRWRVVYMKGPAEARALGVRKNLWRDYSADLSGTLKDYVHPADYGECFEKMNISNLVLQYRSGRAQFVQDYRVRSDANGDYRWHRMTVHAALEPEAGDILAYVYVLNVDAEKNAEQERGERRRVLNQTLTALGGLYSGLYYVNLDNDVCYTAKERGGEVVSKFCAPYRESFEDYISESIHPDDQAAVREMLDAYRLQRSMREGSHSRRKIYRRRSGDGYERCFIIVQPARFENGTIREVVLAMGKLERGEQVD